MGVVSFCYLMYHSYLLTLFCQYTASAYTLNRSQSIVDGQTLISEDGTFEFGFFSPSTTSKKRYVGIWYKRIPTTTVVWVANRDSPLLDTSGVVKISTTTGNLVIVNRTESVIWSSNSPKTAELPVLEFLKTGNLVLREDDDSHVYLWQSFDYPGDTLLPGMKFGKNFKTQMVHSLSSWKNYDDPSYGAFTFKVYVLLKGDLSSDFSKGTKYYSDAVVRNGPNKYFRSGLWNGFINEGLPNYMNNSVFTLEIVSNEVELSATFKLIDQSVLFRCVLFSDGHIGFLIWVNTIRSWRHILSFPTDVCDHYALCGAYTLCDMAKMAVCQCLKKFKPRSPEAWDATDWSHGCEREVSLNCSNGEGFMKITGVKLPDTAGVEVARTNTNLKKCSEICLNNCSCMAYAASGDGSGCIMWFADLVDMRLMLKEDGRDLYIRMAASAIDSIDDSNKRKTIIKIVSGIFSVGALVLGLGSWGIRKIRPKGTERFPTIHAP